MTLPKTEDNWWEDEPEQPSESPQKEKKKFEFKKVERPKTNWKAGRARIFHLLASLFIVSNIILGLVIGSATNIYYVIFAVVYFIPCTIMLLDYRKLLEKERINIEWDNIG